MRSMNVEEYRELPTLRDLRKQKCMSVGEVARALEVRENTVYRWERGFNVPPLVEALMIARLYKTDVGRINWWPYPLND